MDALTLADLVFGLGGAIFIVAMLPTVLDRRAKVPRYSSVTTSAVLYAFAVPYALLGLSFSLASDLLLATAWLAVAVWRSP